ncbi:MAG: hypothetical protein J6D19_06040, partial [Clostridia bacterium]|nr:hypothetical protein [Clostridia bacterium]
RADQGEVRCKSVATIITVIECFGIPKSEYSPSINAKVCAVAYCECTNVFGYEKRSRFVEQG